MPDPIYATVGTAGLVSTNFVLPDARSPRLVEVPSLTAATAVRMQFTTTSGTAPFFDVFREDGSGLVHIVASGPGPAYGYSPRPPTPWGRIAVANSLTQVTTFVLHPLRP